MSKIRTSFNRASGSSKFYAMELNGDQSARWNPELAWTTISTVPGHALEWRCQKFSLRDSDRLLLATNFLHLEYTIYVVKQNYDQELQTKKIGMIYGNVQVVMFLA